MTTRDPNTPENNPAPRTVTGLRGFLVVWAGQLVSLVGTAMTRFAITIWAYQETGSATTLALVAVFAFGPSVLLSPVAGALVDRWNRKAIIMAADTVSGLTTIALLALHAAGSLEVWHLYVAGAVGGAFDAFQFPAFSAAVTTMVPKRHYARASGLMSMAGSVSAIGAPALAGAVLAFGGLNAVLTIDIVTFIVAVGLLAFVRIPPPIETAAGRAARGSLRDDVLYGFRYIGQRPGLLGLLVVFFQANFLISGSTVLLAPMVLARTGSDELVLGAVQSAAGAGGLVGGFLLATWGGPKRRIHGVLMGMALGNLLGPVLIGLGDSVAWWMIGSFGMVFFMPLLNGSSQAIWQAKVEPDVQGRVFATRRLIAQISAPLAMLIAGPLADRVAEPAMAPGGALAPTLGAVLGTGPGAGVALILVASGLLSTVFALAGYLVPAIRNVEHDLPDHELAREGDEDADANENEDAVGEGTGVQVASGAGGGDALLSGSGQGRDAGAVVVASSATSVASTAVVVANSAANVASTAVNVAATASVDRRHQRTRQPQPQPAPSRLRVALLAAGLLLALWAGWWALSPPLAGGA